jgi:hypothetical protein
MPLKFGRKPAKLTRHTVASAMILARHLDPLGTAPTNSNDYVAAVDRAMGGPNKWTMMGNDNVGDCVLEGTLVNEPRPDRLYRARYNGPAIRLRTASGKSITVTPNHAILTPRGFIRAKFIRKGDYLIGASGQQPCFEGVVARSYDDFNKMPAPVQDLFAAGAGNGVFLRTGRVRVPKPIDFHGDEEFVEGNVDVVAPNGFLGRNLYPALGQPESQEQVSRTRGRQGCFAALSRFYQRGILGLFATFGSMSAFGPALAFSGVELGISQVGGLTGRSERMTGLFDLLAQRSRPNTVYGSQFTKFFTGQVPLNCLRKSGPLFSTPSTVPPTKPFVVAGGHHPSSDGSPSDPDLPGYLAWAYPGFVEPDRLVDVEVVDVHAHVYDLSNQRHWYIANGILNHNCTAADSGHQIMLHTANVGSIVVPTTQDVMNAYSAESGYNPNDPSTDQGAAESDVCAYMLKTGILGHKSEMWASVDPININHVKWTMQLFGACRIGVSLPNSAMDQFDNGQPWRAVDPDGGFAGGHDVPIVKYEGDMLYVVTWGRLQGMDLGFFKRYVDESYVEACPDFVQKNGLAPSGLNMNQLLIDMLTLHKKQ